ncbi:transcription termination factor Rho [Krasilnikovia sp. M28-CT-15]|uniref:transcription termination factor Rho n=1 Tax=Krasilnikovia sp. M28-CT-15 TaxID=3373540 RepID=UPI003876980A
MSDTTDVTSGVSDVADDATSTTVTARRRRGGTGLSAMLLPELQSLAASLGISGTARMRKGELIAAITERQGSGAAQSGAAQSGAAQSGAAQTGAAQTGAAQTGGTAAAGTQGGATPRQRATNGAKTAEAPAERSEQRPAASGGAEPAATAATRQAESQPAAAAAKTATAQSASAQSATAQSATAQSATAQSATAQPATAEPATEGDGGRRRRESGSGGDQGGREPAQTDGRAEGERGDRGDRPEREPRNRDRQRNQRGEGNERGERGPRNESHDSDEDNEGGEGGRRSRRSRFRDRRRGRGDRDSGEGQRDGGREPHVAEDDVLVPVAGILDVLDNYAFVRTTGYLSGPNDVYVSMSQVKKHGLRRGDAVTGAVRATAREGDAQRRDKYNPLVRLDTINGMEPEEARRRPEFYKLTPLYPQERLRLETEPHILTTRVIDLVMPIGKGQRALIVSPPKAGKTMVLQALANAITRNNPECHLMVVLVDERPEEVTDMQRSVKGEVIAATFDRPPSDHTTVAELAIERAKRLVELGHDVVVLLDSVTRLGRSYNLAAPASGRIMSGGIDSTALYPPKRFLGAARNIENGGSLTILATALVETGSMMDTVIFEEFKGTGNAELKLDRKIADKRTFPAVDVSASGTRKEEILLGKEELAIVHKLRKVFSSLESSAALDLLLDRLKQTRTNIEFLMQIAKSTPGE